MRSRMSWLSMVSSFVRRRRTAFSSQGPLPAGPLPAYGGDGAVNRGARDRRRTALAGACGLAKKFVRVAPAPVLARLDAAHDGVAAELEVFVRVGSRRGIAAGHVAALQAHPQMHRRRPLPFARLTEGTSRDGEIRGGLQMRTNAAGPGDSLASAAAVAIRFLQCGVQHGLFDVEAVKDVDQDLV